MLMGINVPIRIGRATDQLIDEWGHMMLREGKYTPGQIDAKWTRSMVQEFNRWVEQKGSKVRLAEP